MVHIEKESYILELGFSVPSTIYHSSILPLLFLNLFGLRIKLALKDHP